MHQSELELIRPEWPAPANIQALSTTRLGGVSEGPYAGLNMGFGSGDDIDHVKTNRRIVSDAATMPGEPVWLSQVHDTLCVPASASSCGMQADASFSREPGAVCAVMTADCLPVLFCTEDGEQVAAAHAGWRGLSAGILEATCARLGGPATGIIAWLGPCIGQANYEVGAEVRDAFVRHDRAAVEHFAATRPGHWRADLAGLARQRLRTLGLTSVSGGGWCTHADALQFYSYRRDGVTGRMATLIWRES